MSAVAPVAVSTAAAFPWAAVLTTILGSGLLAALVQSGISAIGANRERHRQGRDTALRAAAPLEAYARAAADTALQSRSYDPYDEDRGILRSIPGPPDIHGLDWKVVPEGLAARAFGFEQVALIAKEYVTGAFDVDDDWALQEHYEQAARLGLLAWRIACDLRREFRLPTADVRIGEWDFSEWLYEQEADIAAKRAKVKAEAAQVAENAT